MGGSRKRVGARQLRLIVDSLTDQDCAILRLVADFRLVSGGHVLRLYFDHRGDSGARAGRRCLERLVRLGVLGRLERRIGGVRAGSSSFIYRLDAVGQRVLQLDGPRRRLTEPSAAFFAHTLAVTELFVATTEAARTHPEVEVLGYQTEPACWRQLGRFGGDRVLRPDLYLRIGIGEFEHRWFIEIDRGTEHLPAIVRKSTTYHDYYHSGIEQAQGGSFPRVLWATTSDERADSIAAALSATSLTTQLFRVERADAAGRVLTDALDAKARASTAEGRT